MSIGTTTYRCDVCGCEREGGRDRLPTIASEVRLERGDRTEIVWHFCDPNCLLRGMVNLYADRPFATDVDLATVLAATSKSPNGEGA